MPRPRKCWQPEEVMADAIEEGADPLQVVERLEANAILLLRRGFYTTAQRAIELVQWVEAQL